MATDSTEQIAPQSSEPPRRSRVALTLPVAVAVVVVALVVYGFLSARSDRLEPGDVAPGFALTLFDGSEMMLSDLRGEVVVLNFWASWCTPCRQEARDLQATWAVYEGRPVAFMGITFKDAEEASHAFIETFGISYPNGFDANGRISRAYGVVAVPETFIVDRDGKLAWHYVGALDAETLSREIDRALGQ